MLCWLKIRSCSVRAWCVSSRRPAQRCVRRLVMGSNYSPQFKEHVPELLITDVRMPPSHRDEGLKAALEVRAHFPTVAILVLSQYVELS